MDNIRLGPGEQSFPTKEETYIVVNNILKGLKMNKVRGKFKVQETTKYAWPGTKVILKAEYDTTIPEDARYATATPSGTIEMYVNNPPAESFFIPGKYYYIEFTEVNNG
jgi:hypothetical protein